MSINGNIPPIPIVKRILDLTLTIPGMLIISPLLLVIALLVRISIGTPVIFRQLRPGYRNRPFWIYKFRTMSDAQNSQGNLLPNSERMTRLGGFLRSYSLDELPEVLNVLLGEMSWVSTRPLLMQYLERYSPEQARQARATWDHRVGADQRAKRPHLG